MFIDLHCTEFPILENNLDMYLCLLYVRIFISPSAVTGHSTVENVLNLHLTMKACEAQVLHERAWIVSK